MQTKDSVSVTFRLSETSRAQLDLLKKRWGVQMAEAIRRAIWIAYRAETSGDKEQPTTPPSGAVLR